MSVSQILCSPCVALVLSAADIIRRENVCMLKPKIITPLLPQKSQFGARVSTVNVIMSADFGNRQLVKRETTHNNSILKSLHYNNIYTPL
jgi:hypothetical protein